MQSPLSSTRPMPGAIPSPRVRSRVLQCAWTAILLTALLTGCANRTPAAEPRDATDSVRRTLDVEGAYATVDGLRMYYEIHGDGPPLVLLHGGGSTIQSTFGRILPILARTHRVIAVESQAHGHTADIDRPMTFEQDADDVAALLATLPVGKADFMGFSNGGTTAIQIAIRHPELVGKLVLAAATFRRDGMQPGFFEGLAGATLADMPAGLKDAYLAANPDTAGLRAMFERDRARMMSFRDIPDVDIHAIQAPTLVIDGDRDVIRVEHALALSRTLADARLAVLPATHGAYLGEVTTLDDTDPRLPALAVGMIEAFLDEGRSVIGSVTPAR